MESAVERLARFVKGCRDALSTDSGSQGRERVRKLLEELLKNEEFLQAYCVAPSPGLYTLHEDTALGFHVLAHVNENPRISPPHDHGESWAIYGQATQYTDVTEWTRTDDGTTLGHAALQPMKRYRLSPGNAAIYQDGVIHSIDYPARSCFVRVTGTNLDRIPRVMFDLTAGTVTQMTPQRAS